jgi:inhibitor of cysteine peptidase
MYSERDAGAQVALHCGESFEVRLPENPTTGYQWRLSEVDVAKLEVIRDEFHAPTSPATGASGQHVWVFLAQASGASVLRITYLRRWQSASPAKTFTLDVSIL